MTSPTPEDRSRALEKIKKLLRLSTSDNSFEAATALRQAQKMMQALGVSVDEIDATEVTSKVVITKEAFGGCAYLARLSHIVSGAFGLVAIWEPGNGKSRIRANIRYIGPRERVQVAYYAHRVVDTAIRKSWYEHLQTNLGIKQKPGARHTFRMAFLTNVEDKVMKLAPTSTEQQQVNAYLRARYGTSLDSKGMRDKVPHDIASYYAGVLASNDFYLHTPLEEQQGALTHET